MVSHSHVFLAGIRPQFAPDTSLKSKSFTPECCKVGKRLFSLEYSAGTIIAYGTVQVTIIKHKGET